MRLLMPDDACRGISVEGAQTGRTTDYCGGRRAICQECEILCQVCLLYRLIVQSQAAGRI